MILRVPLLNHQHKSFGISSKMIFLLWCVCGGFLLHFYESLILDIILKKYYEDPVDSAQDVLDRNLTVLWNPGSESLVEIYKNSPSIITRQLVERTIVAKVIFCKIENSILLSL